MSAHPRGRESSLGPGEDNWTFQWSLWAKALRDIENTDTCECVHIYWDMRCQSNLHWLFRECCYLMRTQTLSNNKNDLWHLYSTLQKPAPDTLILSCAGQVSLSPLYSRVYRGIWAHTVRCGRVVSLSWLLIPRVSGTSSLGGVLC